MVRWLVLASVVGAVVVLYLLNPVDYAFMPKCPVKILTGLSCPSCGIQRAMHALSHGHLLEAWRYNYFLVYSLPYASLFVMQRFFLGGHSKEVVGRVIENKYALYLFVVLFFVWFIVRNLLKI